MLMILCPPGQALLVTVALRYESSTRSIGIKNRHSIEPIHLCRGAGNNRQGSCTIQAEASHSCADSQAICRATIAFEAAVVGS